MRTRKKLSFIVTVVTASICTLIFCGIAGAAPKPAFVVDQQQTMQTGYAAVADGMNVAQIFTPGVAGYLTKVSLLLSAGGGTPLPADLIVEITAVPTSTTAVCIDCTTNRGWQPYPYGVLASATVPASTIQGDFQWYDIPFGVSPYLYGGRAYAIVLRSPGTLSPADYRWAQYQSTVTDGYPGGDAIVSSTCGGCAWDRSLSPANDEAFVTYMKPARPPRK